MPGGATAERTKLPAYVAMTARRGIEPIAT